MKPLISSEISFQLYDTYGFPLDLTEIICQEKGWAIDTSGFNWNNNFLFFFLLLS